MNGANYPGVSWRWWSLSSKSGSTKPLKQEMSDGSIDSSIACGLVFTPDALVEIHHLDGNRNNNRYINLTAVHRPCHDQIHGGANKLSQRVGTHDRYS